MIEAEYADRLGVSQSFDVNDLPALDRTADRLAALRIRHLRLPIDWGSRYETDDGAWLTTIIRRLTPHIDILPSLTLGDLPEPPAWLPELFEALKGAVRFVELRGTGNGTTRSAKLIRAAGHKAVLGVEGSALTALPRQTISSLLGHFDVLGIHHHTPTNGGNVDWPTILAACSELAHALNPRLPIWITSTGYSAWRHDHGAQAQAFADALSSSADRIYWRCLFDRPTQHGQADADKCSGLDDAAGHPRLLARLLKGGVADLKRMLGTVGQMAMPAIVGTRPILVTGGSGFIGANLVDRLAADGHRVLIYDALARDGVERNLRWLNRRHPSRVSFVLGDLRDEQALSKAAASAQAVFHLAGQVAVTTSMTQPLADFEVNARGTLALLEALRQHNPDAPLVFASTNKVYGDLADIELTRESDNYVPANLDVRHNGISEQRPLCFHTPYGCSKGTADQYVLDYAHSFGLRTAVLRMSCIYGERQLGTEDQGWVAHFLLKAIAGEGLTVYGDGRQVRDVLHVGDAVDAYLAAWAKIDSISGRAFNLGGGAENAISLLQLIHHIEDLLGKHVDVTFSGWRPGDQRYYVSDTRAIRRVLGLANALPWRVGVAQLAGHFGASQAQEPVAAAE